MAGELGRASYELDADLRPLRRSMAEGKQSVEGMERTLDALTAISGIAEEALKQIKITAKQAGETEASASAIIAGVRGISDEARTAARDLDRVRISETQATESTIAGERIKRNVNDIGDEADKTTRKLDRMRIAGGVPGRSGVGVGPFGSGFGRVGALGAAIGAGVLTGPAAVPALGGLLAALPVLAGVGVGSLGTLALAFDGVAAAIGGDKKAFDSLTPSAKEFTVTIRSLHGWLDQLKETAAGSLFPGLEKGLNAALSPSTLKGITSAVTELGRALGSAGEIWGKYFGSQEFQSIFGPLMQSAARNIGALAGAALSLFDAIGTLGRAGIPFTEWMTRGIAAGAQLVDTWLHATDATGALGRAMSEAQTSLRLVGALFGSLLNAVGALGQALYPVSKIAVKDLTDGLNALARIIRDNQDGIRDFVFGALSALVSMIKTLAPIVGDLAHMLSNVVHTIGGWKTAFEIIISGFLATKFIELIGAASKAAMAVTSIGTAAEGSAGGVSALRAGLLALGDPLVLAAIAAAGGAFVLYKAFTSKQPTVIGDGNAGAKIVTSNGKMYVQAGPHLTPISPAQAGYTGDGLGPEAMRGAAATTQARPQSYSKSQLAALWVQAGGNPAVADTMASIALAESKGVSNATNYANTDGSTDRGLWQINSVHGYVPSTSYNALQNAKQAVSVYNSQGLGAWSTYTNGAYMQYTAGAGGSSSAFGTMPAFTKNTGAKPTQKTGDALLSDVLRNAISSSKNNATMASSPSVAAHWLSSELDDLEKARKQLNGELDGSKSKRQTAIRNELRSIDGRIADVNKQITTNLKAQATAIKQSFSGDISTAKSNIGSAVSTLKGTLDAQLQQRLQDYITNVLGPQYFQGTDAHGMPLQTPAEAKYAAEQAADTLKSLQDAITTAADPASREAAQHALDEYNDSLAATKERAQADYDYAQAVKKAQSDEEEQQRKLNLAIDQFGRGLLDGSTKLGDLTGIVDGFGLSLTADDGIEGDFDALGSSVQALSKVMYEEAAALARLAGDHSAADDLATKANEIGFGSDVSPTGSFTGGLAGADGYFMLNPIGMADGGAGRTLGPTLFYSGGNEDYMFSGEGSSFADQLSNVKIGGGGETAHVNSFANELDFAIWIGKKLQLANKSNIKFQIV